MIPKVFEKIDDQIGNEFEDLNFEHITIDKDMSYLLSDNVLLIHDNNESTVEILFAPRFYNIDAAIISQIVVEISYGHDCYPFVSRDHFLVEDDGHINFLTKEQHNLMNDKNLHFLGSVGYKMR